MVETQLESRHPFQAPLAAFPVQLGSTLTSQAWNIHFVVCNV